MSDLRSACILEICEAWSIRNSQYQRNRPYNVVLVSLPHPTGLTAGDRSQNPILPTLRETMPMGTIEGPDVHHLDSDQCPNAEAEDILGSQKICRHEIRGNLWIDQNIRSRNSRNESLRRTGVRLSSLVESLDLVSPDDDVAA